MKKNKNNPLVKRRIFTPGGILLTFIIFSFLFSCNIIIFMNGANVSEDIIRTNARFVFGNFIFLSLVFSIGFNISKKIVFEKPTLRILDATTKIGHGDFSVRIKPLHKKAKTEYDVIIDNINTMTEDLSGLETMKLGFIADVSHELKTPLTVIQNYGTILQETDLTDEQLEYAKKITAASRQLSSLITDILNINKLENQQVLKKYTEVNISNQIYDSILQFEKTWTDKNIELDVNVEDDIIITTDTSLTMIIWMNILSNAFKFTENNGHVNITLHKDNDNVIFSVKDDGPGITEEEQKHIFEKFYQGDTSHSSKGNGLGLALVNKCANILNYSIEVKSKKGEGSEFIVTI